MSSRSTAQRLPSILTNDGSLLANSSNYLKVEDIAASSRSAGPRTPLRVEIRAGPFIARRKAKGPLSPPGTPSTPSGDPLPRIKQAAVSDLNASQDAGDEGDTHEGEFYGRRNAKITLHSRPSSVAESSLKRPSPLSRSTSASSIKDQEAILDTGAPRDDTQGTSNDRCPLEVVEEEKGPEIQAVNLPLVEQGPVAFPAGSISTLQENTHDHSEGPRGVAPNINEKEEKPTSLRRFKLPSLKSSKSWTLKSKGPETPKTAPASPVTRKDSKSEIIEGSNRPRDIGGLDADTGNVTRPPS